MINRKWVQTKKTQLYTSIGSTATSILLKNAFKLDGGLLDMEDDFGAIGFMTLEPGGLKEEIISFTGLSYNLSGTILTLSGVTRGRAGEYPYTTGGTAYGHSANRVAIFTNNPQHYEGFANKYNEETITQVWTFTETERPKLDVDRDALLAEEFITLGQANRLIQATYLPPQIVASDSGTTGTSQATSLTISHTIPATIENGGTFVVVNTEENKTVSTVTLGGVALTQVATKTRVTGNIRVEIWRLIAPASGTANLVITPSASAYITAHVISLSNVNQTTPEDALSTGADGSGTAVADSVTTTTQGAVILIGVGTANDPTTFTPTAPLAEQEVNSATTSRPLSSSVRSTTTAGAYALAYTIAPSTNWVTKAVAIRGIAVPGIAGVSSVTGTYIDNTDPSNPVSVVPLNNTTTTNPTVNDDESLGYAVDSKWFNSSTGILWTCTDATDTAAVWVAVSSGTSIVATNVTVFDDFLNWSSITEGGTGTDVEDIRFLYSSIQSDPGTSPSWTWLTNVTNHPGIVTIDTDNDNVVLKSFGIGGDNGDPQGGIPLANDFTLEINARCVYNSVATTNEAVFTINSGSTDAVVKVNAINTTNLLEYTLFGVSGSTTIPASGAWFTIKWTYISGTLRLYINGVLIATQAGTFTTAGDGSHEMFVNLVGGAAMAASMDYIGLNYTVTR